MWNNRLAEIRSLIDYKVGDWVESCHFLPGIVQKIDCYYDNMRQCIVEDVEIFYPDYAIKHPGQYKGGSRCSISNCGVHKITSEYAMKLFSIGEKRLRELWENNPDKEWKEWKEIIEEEFQKLK